jgi:hypothetical protein
MVGHSGILVRRLRRDANLRSRRRGRANCFREFSRDGVDRGWGQPARLFLLASHQAQDRQQEKEQDGTKYVSILTGRKK